VWQVQELFQLDDELIYSLRPDYARVAESEEFVERAHTNAAGLRDDALGPRDAFETRIVVLGDSMIFGHGVSDAETFPNQLEAIYREADRSVDVINAGVKGYGTDGAYKFFVKRILPLGLKPDWVIFAIYTNDLHDNVGQPLYTIEDGSLAPLDPKRNWIYLLGSIDGKLPAFLRDRILYGIVMSRFVGRDVYSVLPDLSEGELIEWSARKAMLQIAALRRIGAREGFRVLVLGVPYRDGPAGFYAWLEPLRERGFEFFDASRAPVWRAWKDELFFPSDYHFTAAGNRLLADQVSEALDDAGL
jgi:lysophospholipase L1-like esterase